MAKAIVEGDLEDFKVPENCPLPQLQKHKAKKRRMTLREKEELKKQKENIVGKKDPLLLAFERAMGNGGVVESKLDPATVLAQLNQSMGTKI